MTDASLPDAAPAPAMTTGRVWLFACVAAFAVANLYYCQPLLAEMARDFGVPLSRAGLVATVTQVGYAVGLLFFVPFADVRERRGLIVALLAATSVTLACAAMAPSLGWMMAASFAVGVSTVVPQVVIPFAAGLAPPAERGRVVGLVVGGLLVGILGARTLAGLVGGVFGWRATFAGAAVLMLVLAAVARKAFPHGPPPSALPYAALFRSLGTVVREQPVVRAAAVTGALTFGSFSVFWTTLAFRLETPPLRYGAEVAGLFGLVGIVGAVAAPLVGRVTDRRSPRVTIAAGMAVALASFVLFFFAGHMVAGLVLGVILLDAGVQGVGVSNQARIYMLPAPLHARLNTVYMSTMFLGGSIGSWLGTTAWGRWHWTGVCAIGIGLLAAALLVHSLMGRESAR